MRTIAIAVTLAALAAPAREARGQEFPPDDEYVPLRCGGGPMGDPVGDQPGAIDERDIVGDDDAPAGLRALDTDYLYLRLRLEDDPADPAGDLQPFGWGMEFDLDGDLTTYEVLVLASGVDQTVSLYENTTTTLPNDPADPPDAPPVATYDFAANGRSTATAPNFGGDPDFFLDLAIPWDDLMPLGLTPISEVVVWAASSSDGTVLDADFACHDGGTGAPELDQIGSDPTTPDPDGDGGGGGGGGGGDGDGDGSGVGELEGGGGCAAGGGAGGPAAALILLALALATRARGRAPSRGRAAPR